MKTLRLQVRILGIVQGVGFRPFVYRLATEIGLKGWVRNDSNGVTIEVEGTEQRLVEFLNRLPREKPPPAYIYTIDHRFLAPAGFEEFKIVESKDSGKPLVWILPDLATCKDCLRETFEPADRRYRYPFTNCTYCGPRFTIIEDLPYDRPRTSMKTFKMCQECQKEYSDPKDRRFHAQPNACPVCGPHVQFWLTDGTVVAEKDDAIKHAVEFLRKGKIVALKGLGGFLLLVDASNEEAVSELRKRKRRPFKAFAVMYPDIDSLKAHVEVPEFAETLLLSPQAPIILLPRKPGGWMEIAESVAPQSPYLGVYLPYTPLHHIILKDFGKPVVATSGNLSDEPIVTDEKDALQRLGNLCHALIVHNRPIVRHADDSVLQFITKPEPRPQLLRRARGYTPLPLLTNKRLPPILALGGHMNVTIGITRGNEIILSQHIGDLDTWESRKVYLRTIDDFLRLYRIKPEYIVHDMHPDYYSTLIAQEFNLPDIAVQHHHAHLSACMLENSIDPPALGLTWDGTGYGVDKTVWGGEFLLGGPHEFKRVATLFPFKLPGSERAIKENWRTGLSLLYESYGADFPQNLPLFDEISEKRAFSILDLIEKGINSPITTSMGRLFDGMSAILGISYFNTHQAQSAQLLEYAAWRAESKVKPLEFQIIEGDPILLDWRPMVRDAVRRLHSGEHPDEIAAAFHRTLMVASLEIAKKIRIKKIALAGGVFCNRFLTEGIIELFTGEGFEVYYHSQLPPTDGSLPAGQIWVATHKIGN